MSSNPDFAEEWMQQWRNAERLLPEIRERELAEMDDNRELLCLDWVYPELPLEEVSGLLIQQRWFMRQRLLETRDA